MKSFALLLLLVAAAVSGVATFVEDAHGTAAAHTHVYGSWWFGALWAAVALLTVAACLRGRMWKRPSALLLHAGLVVTTAGAFLTALSGHKGIVHLRQGIATTSYVDEARQVRHLPFSLTLDSFRVEYYAGTAAPSDYVSQVSCQALEGEWDANPRISMNRAFTARGYRFCQSSFDEDMEGSWLTVDHDPYGQPVAYAGFLLFGLGCLLALVDPRGGFRSLLRHPLLRRSSLLVAIWLASAASGEALTLPVISRAAADSLSASQVLYADRTTPLATPCREFVRKLYGRATFRGLTAEQVVVSWMLHPEAWRRAPILRVKDKELRQRLGLEQDCVALDDLFDDGHYRLQPLWQEEMGKHSRLGKAIRETDEKVGLALMLEQGTLIRALPPGASRLSPAKVKAELWLVGIPFSKVSFMAFLTLGFLSFGLLLRRLLRNRAEPAAEGLLWSVALWLSFAFHATGYALRGFVAGHIPLANGYETMQFVALVALLTACLLGRRFAVVRPFGFLLAGFTLLVAHLGEMNPQITPLMPVLASPWLSWHVSLIMISYALFAFAFLGGLLALMLPTSSDSMAAKPGTGKAEQLALLSRLLVYPATFLLGIGIVLGSVWADVSWGSYWSWDPKETWALVAFVVYGVSLHPRLLPFLGKPRTFHLYMVAAFLVVLMTYFGVNYLLTGMHSYANP